MLLRAVALLALVAGCPANDPSACKAPTAGSGSALGGEPNDLEAELVVADQNGIITVIHDGDTVPLVRAPQGGHILLVGARVHATTSCQYDATGSLRDTASNRVIGLEQRSMPVEATGDGWSQPDSQLSSMPNVAVCPNFATMTQVYAAPYQIEIALRADDQTVVDLKAMVTPMCAADDSYCVTDCAAMMP